MHLPLYAAFLLACTGLMLIPGPNVTLIVATSVGQGARRGLLTMAGAWTGSALQILLVSFGLAQALGTWGTWFGWLRWAGAAYLVVLGLRQFRAAPAAAAVPGGRRDGAAWARGLLVAIANPKTMLFLAAFLPQFVAPDANPARQVAGLAVGYLAVAAVVDCGWVLLARRASGWLSRRGRLANRLSGGMLVGCGAGLALARQS